MEQSSNSGGGHIDNLWKRSLLYSQGWLLRGITPGECPMFGMLSKIGREGVKKVNDE
jgi:hypothetical protein